FKTRGITGIDSKNGTLEVLVKCKLENLKEEPSEMHVNGAHMARVERTRISRDYMTPIYIKKNSSKQEQKEVNPQEQTEKEHTYATPLGIREWNGDTKSRS
ncbi:hypothetical protein L9F63_016839, partial [Diploptera punctata]